MPGPTGLPMTWNIVCFDNYPGPQVGRKVCGGVTHRLWGADRGRRDKACNTKVGIVGEDSSVMKKGSSIEAENP